METLFAKQDRLLMLTSTEIVRTLMHRINWNAQLIAIRGPRGVGKTTCARIFAKTINCLHPTENGEACNECESCVAFNEQRSGIGGYSL